MIKTISKTPLPLSASLIASITLSGLGAANISPTTDMSSIPSPTKPDKAGS